MNSLFGRQRANTWIANLQFKILDIQKLVQGKYNRRHTYTDGDASDIGVKLFCTSESSDKK